jgi:hypothetical protein
MSFDIFDAYATDENLENNGTNFPLGKDSKVLVARAGNRKYSKALTKQVELRRAELDANDEAADAVSDQIMVDVMADTILLGWDKLSFKGVDMPYSLDNAKTLLRIKDFRKVIAGLSDQMDAYKLKAEVEAGKD